MQQAPSVPPEHCRQNALWVERIIRRFERVVPGLEQTSGLTSRDLLLMQQRRQLRSRRFDVLAWVSDVSIHAQWRALPISGCQEVGRRFRDVGTRAAVRTAHQWINGQCIVKPQLTNNPVRPAGTLFHGDPDCRDTCWPGGTPCITRQGGRHCSEQFIAVQAPTNSPSVRQRWVIGREAKQIVGMVVEAVVHAQPLPTSACSKQS